MPASNKASNEPHVLIIGAGLTGLILAHGLGNRGIKYEIFDEAEAAGSYATREWTMGIHWSANVLYDLLPPHISSRIVSEASVDPSLDYSSPPNKGTRIYDGQTGKAFQEVTAEGRLLRVSRARLRKLFSEGVDVRYDHKLIRLSYSDDGTSVTGRFSNGAEYSGTVVCGTDGWRSAVRSELFGPEKARAAPMSGAVHLSAAFSYRDAAVAQHVRTAHPVFSWALDPEVFVFVSIQTTPDPNSPADWGFYLLLGWLGEKDTTLSNAQRLALAKKKAASIAEPFRTAVQAIPDDTILSYSDINSWVAQPWDTHQGRVTLAGDAAHPMPPYRGQGLNNAILDVQNFIKAMAKLKDSRADAGTAVALQTELIEEYSTEVVKRGAAETELSTKIAYEMLQYHDFMREVKYGLAQKAH